jgi:hypothetical protein
MGYLESTATVAVGAASSDPFAHHRIEAEFTLSGMSNASHELRFGFWQAGDELPGLVIAGNKKVDVIGEAGINAVSVSALVVNQKHAAAIEVRGRWVYYYLDGTLISIQGANFDRSAAVVRLTYNGAAGKVSVDSIIARRTRPWLLRGVDRGDYRLAGAPTPGGLIGSYFSEVNAADITVQLSPERQPVVRRLDPTVDLGVATGGD